MFRKQDPYSYTQYQTLYNNVGGTPTPIGLIALEYQVALYNDVQVLNEGSVTQSNTQQFILKCTQRILLQNAATSLSPLETKKSEEEYTDYPVLFKAGIGISTAGPTLELLDYSPHTVNTSVQQSTSHADGSQSGTGTSTSNTTGTWNSQSSTYGVTVA